MRMILVGGFGEALLMGSWHELNQECICEGYRGKADEAELGHLNGLDKLAIQDLF